jgi:hypothetical protein
MKTYKIKIDGKEHEVFGCPICENKPDNLSCSFMPIAGISCYECKTGTMGSVNNIESIVKDWNKRAS